jgi:CdiI N-terminal domain
VKASPSASDDALAKARFDIRFDDGGRATLEGLLKGRLIAGPGEEDVRRFESTTQYWPQERYERQWREGVTRILDGRPSSCLLTTLYGPPGAWFVYLFELHSDGDIVWVVPRYPGEIIPASFDPATPYDSVLPAPEPGEQPAYERLPVSRSAVADWLAQTRN